VIDERTRATYEMAKKKAIREGLDLLEVMDQAGLVRSEDKIKSDWGDCLQRLWLNIDEQPEVALIQLGDGQNTPRDIKRGILRYIEIFSDLFAGGKQL
jgi:hypothetical protein